MEVDKVSVSGTDSFTLPLAAIFCIAIAAYVALIVVGLSVRQCLLKKGVCWLVVTVDLYLPVPPSWILTAPPIRSVSALMSALVQLARSVPAPSAVRIPTVGTRVVLPSAVTVSCVSVRVARIPVPPRSVQP
ncbi:hypothetical protein Pmani_039972 [Petrolisthes manimaculis]|uniref:Uncharacterized protein n=1 Tax=Petrolisthes manimaculis TaxID=1843537 RepID=A0AAE1ND14_9EUCA|nr:hypothetical protein Pmani_039972 [Petrolisthes manimaculis]